MLDVLKKKKKKESITVQHRHLKSASVKEPQSLRRLLCTHIQTLWTLKKFKEQTRQNWDGMLLYQKAHEHHGHRVRWPFISEGKNEEKIYTLPFLKEQEQEQFIFSWKTIEAHEHRRTGNTFSAPEICSCACRSMGWCTSNQLSSGWCSRNIDFKEEGSMRQTLLNLGLCIDIWKD